MGEQVLRVFSLKRILFFGVTCDYIPVMNERVPLEAALLKGDTGYISPESDVLGRIGVGLTILSQTSQLIKGEFMKHSKISCAAASSSTLWIDLLRHSVCRMAIE